MLPARVDTCFLITHFALVSFFRYWIKDGTAIMTDQCAQTATHTPTRINAYYSISSVHRPYRAYVGAFRHGTLIASDYAVEIYPW